MCLETHTPTKKENLGKAQALQYGAVPALPLGYAVYNQRLTSRQAAG